MNAPTDYIEDELYGQRLLISVNADQRELLSNIRAARAILHSFADVTIIINAHTMSFGHKNPEYTIDGQLGDRKGIMGEKGVTAANWRLHPSQQEIASTEHYADFSLDIRPTSDFLGELLRHSDGIEVLEPLTLREKMRQMIAENLKRY